jgi:ELWxxDGT repeat protein
MELWRTDGTAAGTQIVKDVLTGPSSGIARQPHIPALAAVGDTVYFKAFTDELWKSDGTAAGTQLVKDFGFNNFASDWVQGFVPAGGKLFFEGLNNYPWVSNGTDAGTRELIMRRVVSPIVPFGNGVAFWGLDPLANTIRLYRSDGTPEGTTLLGTPSGTVVVPAGQTEQQAPVVSNGVLYFAGRDDANGMELWKSDGTDAGTVLVSNIRPDKADSNPGQFVSFGGRVYFTADDGTHGRELWSTDGTPGGTRLEQDLNPGAASAFAPPTSNISNAPVATADEVLFVAQDDQVGRELFRVPGAAPAGQVVARKLFYNGSAFDGRDISINPADAGAIAPDKAALLPGQTATSANVSSYERGINGLIVDVQGLVAGLHRTDFEFAVMRSPATGWVEAPAPLEIETRFSPIPELPARVTFVWADGTLRNAWLRVTVKANANTRLPEPDVFYFGSLPGDTGGTGGFTVDGGDVLTTRRAVSPAAAAPLTSPFDHNRDGRVSADDLAVVRRNFGGSLPPLAVPIPAQSAAVPPPSRGPVRPRERRWLLAE